VVFLFDKRLCVYRRLRSSLKRGKGLRRQKNPVVKSSFVREIHPYPFIRNRIDLHKTYPLELHHPAQLRPDELITTAEIIVDQ